MNSVEYVKKVCKDRKIAISKLEKDLGFSNGYIGQLRKGVFPYDRALKIAKYLSIPVGFLLGSEEEHFYSPDVSRSICREIKLALEKNPEKFIGFVIPPEILKKIEEESYIFSSVTFPQFGERLNKSIEDFISQTKKAPTSEPDRKITEEEIKAAFFEGSEDLPPEEMAALWDDARDYIQWKINQRRKKND